ncbi:hypothetical protein ACHAXA_010947 [Cyclostephanos tholiformis]|uniref:Fanconi anemia group M protein n=1 Tax=Cyclostephanos tholiformis TaxID=382380 RepID=A0ABD3R7R7_9STRA
MMMDDVYTAPSSSTTGGGPVPLCPDSRGQWIYPVDEKYPERSYQVEITKSAILYNTLVSLPTGLGKTLIAAVTMYNFYRWYPTGKVVFCAPTRPLVSQQIRACYKITGIPERHTAEISGRSKPESRSVMWKNKRVFFCTPQTLVKDIEEGRCDASLIVCVVMDEAHRATGEHANSVLVRLIDGSGARYRLLGLSATPGTDIKSIQAVCSRLNISRIESRAEDDPDVRGYIHHREEEVIVVRQPDVVKSLDYKFSELIMPILTRLREMRVSSRLQYDSATLQSWSVMQANREYVERTGDYTMNGQFNVLRELVNARTLLKVHGVQMARTKLAEAAGKSFMNYISGKREFVSLMRDLETASGGGARQDGMRVGAVTESDGYENNPKLFKLVEVLMEHFERKEVTGQSTRVIVFSQWRESVGEIVKMLISQNSPLLKPAQFIGQASKKSAGTGRKGPSNYSTGQDTAGMNQAQQQRVLQQFSDGMYNILVCTCVGEEGLDIGDVDLIVNFDVMKSPIRSIQRNGRTGRKRDGRVVFLVAEHEEKSYGQSVANSKKIARALRDPSVFKLCKNIPMFQVEPELLRKTLKVATFRLSQVGGHTPKTRGLNDGSKNKRVKSKPIESDWRLDRIDDADRINLFGHLPRSSCREYEKSSYDFPISLKRKYLNLRNQSIYTKMLLKGQAEKVIMAVGRSSAIVRKLETMHSTGEVFRNRHPQLHEVGEIDVTSDCDCLDQMSLGGQSISNWPAYVERRIISPDNSLDDIFGPIVQVNRDIGVDLAQLAKLFDAEHHRNCAIIAPHGVTFDSTDESASSNFSDTSLNDDDDLCAFFDNDYIIDSERHQAQSPYISEMKAPHLNHSFDDQANEDIIDGPPAYDKVEVSSKCPELSLLNDGEIQMSSHTEEYANEEKIGWTVEKENINTQSPHGPPHARRLSHSSFTKEKSHLSYEEIENARVSHADNCEHITPKFPIVTSFRLPTPPPSSDESDDDCSGEDEAELQQGPAHDAKHDSSSALSLAYTTIDMFVENTVQEEANSSKVAAFFQLQTQYSSSEREEDDDSVDSDEHTTAHICPKTKDFFLPSDGEEEALTSASKENIVAGLKSTLGQFKGAPSIIFSGSENLTDTPIKTNIVNSAQNANMSLVNLTDTPLLPRQTYGQQRKSVDSLTGIPNPPRQQVSQQRTSLDSLTDTPLQRPKNAGLKRKRLRAAPDKQNRIQPEARSTVQVPEKERVRKRIEEKYRCRFLDTEAANDDSDESDEEEAVKQIEDEEMSCDSFINDSSQLGYTQDDLDCLGADAVVEDCEREASFLHRQIYHQRELENQLKTPILNRRMKNSLNESQDSQHSQTGLGNMNFIRSVLDYHRAGGDSEQLEEEFHRLAGINQSQIESPIAMQVNQTSSNPGTCSQSTFSNFQSSNQVSQTDCAPVRHLPTLSSTVVPSTQPLVLTIEQQAMIEANRVEALRRRQQRLQQKAVQFNPYAK